MVDPKRSAAAKKGWITRRKNMAKKLAAKTANKAKADIVPAQKIIVPDAVKNAPVSVSNKGVIKEFFPDKKLCEIYGSGLQFALVSKDWRQCHPFCYCKDFLQDAIWAEVNKSSVNIYSFKHEHGKNPPIDFDETRVLVRFKGKKGIKKLCEQSIAFLNAMEKDLDFEPSRLYFGGKYPDTPSSTFVFEGDARWLYSPPLISLYTLSIRVGLTYEGGPWRTHFKSAKSYLGSNDNYYTNTADKGLDKLLGKKPEEIFAPTFSGNYPSNASVGAMHGSSGILAFGKNAVNYAVKAHWKNG